MQKKRRRLYLFNEEESILWFKIFHNKSVPLLEHTSVKIYRFSDSHHSFACSHKTLLSSGYMHTCQHIVYHAVVYPELLRCRSSTEGSGQAHKRPGRLSLISDPGQTFEEFLYSP